MTKYTIDEKEVSRYEFQQYILENFCYARIQAFGGFYEWCIKNESLCITDKEWHLDTTDYIKPEYITERLGFSNRAIEEWHLDTTTDVATAVVYGRK